MVLCIVTKGIKSFVYQTTDNKNNNNKVVIPVVTCKLLQACISILISSFEIHRTLPHAKLGANVVRVFNLKEAGIDEQI